MGLKGPTRKEPGLKPQPDAEARFFLVFFLVSYVCICYNLCQIVPELKENKSFVFLGSQ